MGELTKHSVKKGSVRVKQINISCPYCGAKAVRRSAQVVRRNAGSGEEVYVCARYPVCDAYVAAHRDSRLPMGTLANRKLRQMRRDAHLALNRLWEDGYMSKKEAYRWLQVQLGLPEAEAHIAHFSEYRCAQVICLCDGFTGAAYKAA